MKTLYPRGKCACHRKDRLWCGFSVKLLNQALLEDRIYIYQGRLYRRSDNMPVGRR
jgi:hypothetical protein